MQNYKRGTAQDEILGAQHGVDWIPSGYPGEGNFLLFNNQHEFYGPNNPNSRSAVLEISPPINDDGSYAIINGDSFGPTSPIWIYQDQFFSNFQSGAFRLPNGNTIITSSADELIVEVNRFGEIELTYNSYNNSRAIKYGLDYLNSSLQGDISEDGLVNVLDIIELINILAMNAFCKTG